MRKEGALEFERYIDETFERNRVGKDGFALAPFIRLPYDVKNSATTEKLKSLVWAALEARASFRRTAPSWAPDLPVSLHASLHMSWETDPRRQLVGMFAWSALELEWDRRHPPFAPYARGLMAHPCAPDLLRDDVELRQEFPPVPLIGLDWDMCWRTPDRHKAAEAIRQQISDVDPRITF